MLCRTRSANSNLIISPAFFVESDIRTCELTKCKIACDPGKNSVRIPLLQLLQAKVGGDDRAFLSKHPLVSARKKLGRDEGVGYLRSQIIYDHQVTIV